MSVAGILETGCDEVVVVIGWVDRVLLVKCDGRWADGDLVFTPEISLDITPFLDNLALPTECDTAVNVLSALFCFDASRRNLLAGLHTSW